ncbi:hypothetical protein P9272_23935 [Mesorhizobium sp. WSM4976]|uniref:hypothetical protein n=1 Tax=Mesorhizobium sp. WSM4976 TaxID=3038549 RepID=UPI0024174F3E|nr:hypothetical protein [Mesorhizobium sp. WSM4976]MDG4896622.1 hypothetical protein [Mesorhizobium sp. WSM4976]
MAKRTSHPAADQRAIDLREIDTEIARLEKLLASKKDVLDADKRQHALDQDVDLQQRLKGEIGDINELLGKQRERRFKTELGEAEPPKPAVPVQHRAWDIDEKALTAGEPAYPDVVRGSEADVDVFSRAYLAIKAYWEALIKDLFRKDGYHPDDRVTFDFVTSMQGEVMANFRWYSARCKALEDRVKQLEERPSVEYRGSWKADEKYRRGDLISHAGSVWHCELAGSGIVPGEGAIGWRLAVKRGRDGKDATR